MTFTPFEDPRPHDIVWPAMLWPVPANTVLSNSVVTLTPTTLEDAGELLEALNQPNVFTHLPVDSPQTVDEWRDRIATTQWQDDWFQWTVRLGRSLGDRAANALVGTTSFLDTAVRDARTEIGATTYTPAVWGTAVNVATKFLLLEFAFDTLRVGRVQLKTDIRNVRSQWAIQRLGATYEGVLRRHYRRSDGTIRDSVLFSIVAEDWPRVKESLEQRLASKLAD